MSSFVNYNVSFHKQQETKVTFRTLAWQRPIIASFYEGAKLPLKGKLSGQVGPNEECVLHFGRELFAQTAIKLHC